MPGHTFLYSPPSLSAASSSRAGELGEIYFITTSRVNLGLHQSDVSVVWDLAPHDFSILRYWLDEMPTRVSAVSRGCMVEGTADVAFIDLEFAVGDDRSRGDRLARAEQAAPDRGRRLGEDAGLRRHQQRAGADLRLRRRRSRIRRRSGSIASPTAPATSSHRAVEAQEPLSLELTDFCEAVRTGSQPRSSAELGLDVVAMTEAVDRSLALGGQPVACEPLELGSADGSRV